MIFTKQHICIAVGEVYEVSSSKLVDIRVLSLTAYLKNELTPSST